MVASCHAIRTLRAVELRPITATRQWLRDLLGTPLFQLATPSFSFCMRDASAETSSFANQLNSVPHWSASLDPDLSLQ